MNLDEDIMQTDEVPCSEDGHEDVMDTSVFQDPPPDTDGEPQNLSNAIPKHPHEANADTIMPDVNDIPVNNPPVTSMPDASVSDLPAAPTAVPTSDPDTNTNTIQQDPVATSNGTVEDIILIDDDIGSVDDGSVYTFHRIWPLDRNIFLPAQELPSVIPGETRVPPCTIRYRLPHGLNTHFDNVTSPVRKILLRQLVAYNPTNGAGMTCAESVRLAFPKPLGKKDARYFTVDITADSPAHFELIRNTKFSLNKERLEILDLGAPVPANLVTVTLNHLPSQNDPKDMGQQVAEALCRENKDVVCHDVFQRHEVISVGNKHLENQDGTIVASIQFVTAPPTKFPDALIRETFPGWVEIRNIPYQIFYVGRINHCGRFVTDYRI
jgi:hypothetical protein